MRVRLWLAALLFALPAAGQSGFDSARLARLDTFLQGYVDRGEIAGAVALVTRNGHVVFERAVGWQDKEAGKRMTVNSIFRVASETKEITSAAVLMLVEEGKIGLNDPIDHWIPAFEHTTVLAHTDRGTSIVPAMRVITVRDLLTHTSGITTGLDSSLSAMYAAKGLGPAAGPWFYLADKNETVCTTVERLATLPFAAQPGVGWAYGYSLDVAGCLVERVSGMPLDAFIASRITKPLGMKDTHFFLPPRDSSRLTTVYGNGPDGKIFRAPAGARGQGDYLHGPRKDFSGGAGLLSTARDWARFTQMIMNGGELDGVRLLAPHTVELMTSDQIGGHYGANGRGFGLGYETVDKYGANGMASVGSFGWSGAYGTWDRADPKEHLVMVLMVQLLPNLSSVRDRFPNLVYQALTH